MNEPDKKGVIRPSILTEPAPDVKVAYISANGSDISHFTLSNDDSKLNNKVKLSTKSIENIYQKVTLSVVIPSSELIDGRFLPSELLINLIKQHGKKAVLLRSGLGTGKSWSLSEVMQGQGQGRGVAACHRIGLTQQLSDKFNADNYRSVRDAGGEYSDRLGTTIHSLPRMLTTDRTANAFDNGLFVLDESNSCAAEITNATVKNEALTIQSVGEAYRKAELMVCADAHLDLSTVDLLEAAGVPLDEMMLIVVDYPELDGYTVNIWEDEKTETGKPATKAAFMNQILADVRNGLKVIVTSLSATFLEELNREAEKQGIPDRFGNVRLVTSDTPMIDREALTADSYQDDVLTMMSPAMTTGISFNRTVIAEDGTVKNCPDYKHADRCYVVLSNGMDTGSYQDGLQAMMRERVVKDATINCYYAESPVPLPSDSRIALIHQNDIKAAKAAFDELAKHVPGVNAAEIWNRSRPSHDKADAFLLSQALRIGEQKRDFLELFIEECQAKGATVNMRQVSDLADGEITFQMLQAEKQREREEWKQARIDAMKLDSEEVDGLDDAIAKPALDRLFIEEQALIDFDQLEESERGEWIDRFYPEKGRRIIEVVREIERSQADKKLIADIVYAAMIGASGGEGDRLRFLEKSNTDKKHWFNRAKYTQLVLKAAGVTEVEGELIAGGDVVLNDKEVRKRKSPSSGLFQSLKINPEPAIMCGYLNIETKPAEVKAKPLPFIIDMLASLGIKTRKARNKQEWKVQADSLETVLAMVNRRKDGGINELKDWLDVINEYIESYHARKSAQNERDSGNKEKTPDDVLTALTGALDKAGRPELLNEAIEYFEPFHNRIKAKKLSVTMLHLMVKRWLENAPD